MSESTGGELPVPLGGFFSILQTPFAPDGEIDEAALVRLLEHRIEVGADGILLLAIASEGNFLSRGEKARIVDRVVRELDGRLPVIAAAYDPATRGVIELGRQWADLGAAAIVAFPSYGTPPSADAILRHCDDITRNVPVPLILQDEPNTSGVAMDAEVIARITQDIEGVAGVKVEGKPVTDKLTAVRAVASDSTRLFSAAGTSFVQELERGSNGMMSGYVFPEVVVEVLGMFAAGDVRGANDLWDRYLPFTVSEGDPRTSWSVRKHILVRRGLIDSATVRDPAPSIDDTAVRELDAQVARLGLLEQYPVGAAVAVARA